MRKKLWKEQHNNSEIVTYKPSLNISLQGNINSFLGNLLSLKIFVDSNFDEESNIKESNVIEIINDLIIS